MMLAAVVDFDLKYIPVNVYGLYLRAIKYRKQYRTQYL